MTKELTAPHPTLPELGRVLTTAPSPDWGRLGWGVSRKGLFQMRHTGLDPVSPASIEGFKIIPPLASVQLCDSETSSE